MPPIDATFYSTVGLVLFLALIFYMGVPGKLMAALDSRADDIRKELDEARSLREEAQGLLADYQRRAREAEKEAQSIIDDAKAEAERVATEATTSLEEMIERRAKTAEEKIAQAEGQALADVRSIATDVAVSAAQKILAQKVPGNIGAKIMDESIKQVGDRLN